MGHPYAPQSMFLYQRRKGAPVPTAYDGIGNYATSYGPAKKTYTRGSLSYKTSYAKPQYIRDELDESMAGFGFDDFDAQGCALAAIADPFKLAELIVMASPLPGPASGPAVQVIGQGLKTIAQTVFDALKERLRASDREGFVSDLANNLPESIESLPGVSRRSIAGFAYDQLMKLAESCGTTAAVPTQEFNPQLMQIGIIQPLSTGQGYTGTVAPGSSRVAAVSKPVVGVGTGAASSLKVDLKSTVVQTAAQSVIGSITRCLQAGGTPQVAPPGVIDPKKSPRLLAGYSVGQLKTYLAFYAKDFKKWGLLDLPDATVVDVHCTSGLGTVVLVAGVAAVALLAMRFMK